MKDSPITKRVSMRACFNPTVLEELSSKIKEREQKQQTKKVYEVANHVISEPITKIPAKATGTNAKSTTFEKPAEILRVKEVASMLIEAKTPEDATVKKACLSKLPGNCALL